METIYGAAKFLFVALFASLLMAGSAHADTVYISSCQALDQAGTTYVLTQTVVTPKPNIPYTDITCFNVTAPNVTIDCDGFTIDGNATYSREEAGVYSQQYGTNVMNCNIVQFQNGIHMNGASNFAIENTNSTVVVPGKAIFIENSNIGTITDTIAKSTEGTYNLSSGNTYNFAGYALYLSGSSSIEITDSTGSSATNEGVYMTGSSDNTLTNVVAVSNYTHVIGLKSGSHGNTIINPSIIAGQPKGKSGVYNLGGANLSVDCQGGTITGLVNPEDTYYVHKYGIYSSGQGTEVAGCTVQDFYYGILFNGTSNGAVEDVNIAGTTGYGLRIASGSDNTVDNVVVPNGGITLYEASNSQVLNSNGGGLALSRGSNNMVDNFNGGEISLYDVNYSSVSDSSGTSMSGYGLRLEKSSNNAITNFTGVTNFSSAIALDSHSDNNVISGCSGTALGVTVPLSSGWGLMVEQSSNNVITDCTFYSPVSVGAIITLESYNNTLANSEISGKTGGFISFGALVMNYNAIGNTIANNTVDGLGGANAVALIAPWNNVPGNVAGNAFYNNTISNADNLLYIEENNTGNTFYWNTFNDAGTYVNDLAGGNTYNTTMAGQGEGNIYANVLDGTIQVQGDSPSAYGSGLYVGTAGTGFPYGTANSGGKFIAGTEDYAPLTPYTITPPEYATLTVTKIVVNDNGGTMEVSDFPLYIDTTLVASGVPNTVIAGAHNVNELGNFGYAATISGDCAPNGDITLAADDVKSCTITNDDIPSAMATLTVTKIVMNDNGGTAVAGDFTFYVDALQVFSGVPNTVVPGTYTVSEDLFTGYEGTIGGDCTLGGSVTLAPGDAKTCTITNDDMPATIRGFKYEDMNANGGHNEGEPLLSGWTIYLDENMNGMLDTGEQSTVTEENGEYEFTGLSAGEHHVKEVQQAGWETTEPAGGAHDHGVILANGEVREGLNFGNYVMPTLTVTKVVINDDNGTNVVSDFQLFVGATQVYSGISNSFSAGAYTVSETPDAGYTSTISGDCSSEGLITLAVGDVKACTITNDDVDVGVCILVPSADLNGDLKIDSVELMIYINKWKAGEVTSINLMKAINFWKAGTGC